jgi:TPR repeat protein
MAGRGTKKNKKAAAEWCMKSADQGNPPAVLKLGFSLFPLDSFLLTDLNGGS